MTGRHKTQDLKYELAHQMRQAMHDSRPGSLLVGEHCHDLTLDVSGGGWDGVMNRAGFTRPVWTWLPMRALRPSSSARS